MRYFKEIFRQIRPLVFALKIPPSPAVKIYLFLQAETHGKSSITLHNKRLNSTGHLQKTDEIRPLAD